MSNKIENLLNRSLEEWGNVSTKQFERDLKLIKTIYLKQQSIIHEQEQEVSLLKSFARIELSDRDFMMKTFKLTEEAYDSLIRCTEAMLAVNKLNKKEFKWFFNSVLKEKIETM